MRFTSQPKRLSLLALFLFTISLATFGAESFRLDNGLTVILSERPGVGVVSGRLAFKVGSGNEPSAAEYGLAHLLEHMLFKTTPKRAVGQAAREVEENGGSINAYTGKDTTTYVIDLPAGSVDRMLDIFSDMVIAPLFNPDEYAEEKEVVAEEINESKDKPNTAMWNAFFRELFGDAHPYAHPILGSAESVRAMTGEAIRLFHSRNYRPDNAVLVLVGEFDSGEVRDLVARYFGDWKNPDLPTPALPAAPTPVRSTPAVAIELSPQTALAKVAIGFRGFSGVSPDAVTADLLAETMAGGLSSRLVESVKKRQELVTTIGAFSMNLRDDGYFAVFLETTPDKVVAAVDATFREMRASVADSPSAEELRRAQALVRKDSLTLQDSSGGDADSLVFFETTAGDWRLRDLYGPTLAGIGADSVSALAGDLFGQGNATIVALLPASEGESADSYAAKLGDLAQAFAPAAPAAAAKAAPRFAELPPVAGVRLLVMRDPTRRTVNVVAGVRGGLLVETDADNGIGQLMAGAWPKATRDMPADVLAREIENLGASISGYAGYVRTGLSGSFIEDNWRDGLRLFNAVLTRPAFAASDVEEARRELLAKIARRDENPSNRAWQLADVTFYGNHPYGREILGRAESVAGLTAANLSDMYARTVRDGELVIAVAGNVDPEEVRAIMQEGLDSWRREAATPAPVVPVAPGAPEQATLAVREQAGAQTHIVFVFPGPALESPDRAAMEVLSTHLGGMGGALFVELRERQSLAYSTYPYFTALPDSGNLKLYISCDARKTKTAVDGMRQVVDDLIENGVTPEKAESAKRFLTGNLRIADQTLSRKTNQALANVVNGLGLDYQERYMKAISEVTAEDLNRIIRTYLDPSRVVIALLGPGEELGKAMNDE